MAMQIKLFVVVAVVVVVVVVVFVDVVVLCSLPPDFRSVPRFSLVHFS